MRSQYISVFYSHELSLYLTSSFSFSDNFRMPEFSQICLDCRGNSLSSLNDANWNSNLRCNNAAHNVSNEGILSFFKNVDNSFIVQYTSDLELLAAFLVGRFGDGGVGIELFGMFYSKQEDLVENVWHKRQYLGSLVYCPLE